MNNIFNIKRFGLVFRKDIMEGWKRYLLMFLTMLGIIALMLTWNYWEHYRYIEDTGNQSPWINNRILINLSLMFGAFGLIFASTFMSPMNSKTKRITYLVCPSSDFEKYFTRWIIVTIVYIVSFFIAMWVADALRVAICSARYPDLDVAFVDLTKLIDPSVDWKGGGYVFPQYLFIMFVSIYLLFQSLFVLGSTFWEKVSFVKTFTVGALIVLSFVLLCRWAILLFYGELEGFGNVLNSFEPIDKKNLDKERALLYISCVISVFTLANWVLAFFRFRESEIIKRL